MSNRKKKSRQIPPNDNKRNREQEGPPSASIETHRDKTDAANTTKNSNGTNRVSRYSRSYVHYLWKQFFKEKSAAWTAIFTGVLMFFTFLLYRVADRTDETQRIIQRAFVAFNGVQFGRKIRDPTTSKIIGVEIYGVWQNSGTTPTKDALTHWSYQWRSDQLPKGFNFPDLVDPEGSPNRPFVIGPKGATTTTPIVIPMDILYAVQKGEQHFYLWGWVTYHDIFKRTSEHTTQFCVEVTNVTSSVADLSDPTGTIMAVPVVCEEHNCYDEQCKGR